MSTAPLLRVEHLSRRFGGLRAADGADLCVLDGEIHGLMGPNGAGKTTLINLISGMLLPDAGRVAMGSHDITRMPMHRRVRLGLVRTFQVSSVFGGFSVLDNIALAVQSRTGGSMRFWRPARAERWRRDMAADIAARVGLERQLDQRAAAMSHGEQRRLELGLALALEPRLLLLDEPMAGMGAEESAHMVELLRAMRGGLAMLLVEHDVDAVFSLADTVSVLVAGRVLASGTVPAVRADPAVQRAYLGDESLPDSGQSLSAGSPHPVGGGAVPVGGHRD